MSPPKLINTCIRITPAQRDALDQLAEKQDMNMSQIVRKMLDREIGRWTLDHEARCSTSTE